MANFIESDELIYYPPFKRSRKPLRWYQHHFWESDCEKAKELAQKRYSNANITVESTVNGTQINLFIEFKDEADEAEFIFRASIC
jgi:hypothetical protein